MSDISMPPEPPRPAVKPDNVAVRTLGTLMALLAPVPVLIVLLQLWLAIGTAPDAPSNPIALFRQMLSGGGDAPLWLVPLAFAPSALLIWLLFRTVRARVYAAVALVAAALTAALLFNEFISGWAN
jgi:hypothetical protein